MFETAGERRKFENRAMAEVTYFVALPFIATVLRKFGDVPDDLSAL
jgi:hypothetical protein